jgi:hypothetical protein
MHFIDQYQAAKATADKETRARFGADSVPCEPGSAAHTFWLSIIDAAFTGEAV